MLLLFPTVYKEPGCMLVDMIGQMVSHLLTEQVRFSLPSGWIAPLYLCVLQRVELATT